MKLYHNYQKSKEKQSLTQVEKTALSWANQECEDQSTVLAIRPNSLSRNEATLMDVAQERRGH